MSSASSASDIRAFAAGLRQFVRDFTSYAGRRGLVAAILMALGAVFESLGLVLIIPLVGVVMGSDLSSGRLGRTASALFHRLGIERPFGQLSLLLGIFAALVIVRAFVISYRDV